MKITAKNIKKTFGSHQALAGIDFTADSGKLVALLGPSGSGKTTLLRILAGLEFPDAESGGEVFFCDESVTYKPAGERGVGFAFQHYALFRHMTVAQNVAFGLNVRTRKTRPSRAEIADRVNELLRLVQLQDFAKRYPDQLSGGQRQRVALARALAVEPKVLLLDEPFGALDAKVRKELRRWLREFHHQIGLTTIFVTHDQEEALEIADEVVVMNNALIEQVGDPLEVYDKPASAFVAEFLGNVNKVKLKGDQLTYIRPHDILLSRTFTEGYLTGTIEEINYIGSLARYIVKLEDGQTLEIELNRQGWDSSGHEKGDHVYLNILRQHSFETSRDLDTAKASA